MSCRELPGQLPALRCLWLPLAAPLRWGFLVPRGRLGGWELRGKAASARPSAGALGDFVCSSRNKSQGSFSLTLPVEICNFLTESAELVKMTFSIGGLYILMENFPTHFINTLDIVLSFLLFVYQCLATKPNF